MLSLSQSVPQSLHRQTVSTAGLHSQLALSLSLSVSASDVSPAGGRPQVIVPDGRSSPAVVTRKLPSFSCAPVARGDRCFNLMLSVEFSAIARLAPAARLRVRLCAPDGGVQAPLPPTPRTSSPDDLQVHKSCSYGHSTVIHVVYVGVIVHLSSEYFVLDYNCFRYLELITLKFESAHQ